MTHTGGDAPDGSAEQDGSTARWREKYSELPPLVDPADAVISVDPDDPPDPEGGRNTEQDFVARHGLG